MPWSAALPALVIATFLVTAWSRRWTSDDAFINFRVVKQIEAGHGPVFNAGERVEVFTSTLWLAILTIVDLVSPGRLEWTAVAAQLVLGAFGLAAGMAGAMRLARLRHQGPSTAGAAEIAVPVGAAAYLAVPVAWDFATSGLENSLGLAWLGATFWAVAALMDHATAGDDAAGRASRVGRRRLLLTAALVGLGVLVRPDFVPFCVGFGLPVAVVAFRRARVRGLVAVAAAAGALPLAVQVFRMGYYAQLVPNTLHAKESQLAWWSQGWTYLTNFANPYALVVPLLATLAWLALTWRGAGSADVAGAANGGGGAVRLRAWRLVVAGIEGAAVLHALGIVRVGGDYMHGRLLLPTWFALLLPVLAVPARDLRPRSRAGLALAIGAWALVVAIGTAPPEGSMFSSSLTETVPAEALAEAGIEPIGVVDMRASALTVSTVDHPVRWDDYAFAHTSPAFARGERRPYLPGTYVVTWSGAYPTAPGIEAMVVPGYVLGAESYAEGLDVWVFDRLGLADPVVGRAELVRRGTPGHEKLLGPAWVVAAWIDPDAAVPDPAGIAGISPLALSWSGSDQTSEVDLDEFPADREAAYEALHCGELQELVHDTRAPLSPQRFLGNIVDAVRLHSVRVPIDPHEARARFCD